MRRLLHSVRKDAILQYRGSFYFVGAFVAVFYVMLFRQIPAGWPLDLPLLIPAILAINVMITTFYFVAALVLLERAEGTLPALAVSPLRPAEYIGSKVASLTFLTIAENAIVVFFIYGGDLALVQLLFGLVSLCAFYTLVGLAAISRFESISDYLIPSALCVTALLLPLASHFGATDTSLMYVHPLQPFLSLLSSAFVPAPPLELAYAVVCGIAWLILAYAAARRGYGRLIVQ